MREKPKRLKEKSRKTRRKPKQWRGNQLYIYRCVTGVSRSDKKSRQQSLTLRLLAHQKSRIVYIKSTSETEDFVPTLALFDSGNEAGPLIKLQKLLGLGYCESDIDTSGKIELRSIGGDIFTLGSIYLQVRDSDARGLPDRYLRFQVWSPNPPDRFEEEVIFGEFAVCRTKLQIVRRTLPIDPRSRDRGKTPKQGKSRKGDADRRRKKKRKQNCCTIM